MRHGFDHQTSYRPVDKPGVRLIAFEDLRVRSMTKKPRANQDENGHWLRNKASAKAGLNAKILASAWGKTRDFAKYKTLRRHKLLVEVPAAYTSQECGQCGHNHSDNRRTQAEFVCQRCGCHANADDNVAQVIAGRGVALILSGAYAPRQKKKTMRLKNKVGAGCSEPLPETAATPIEITVSRGKGTRAAHRSRKLETSATGRRL